MSATYTGELIGKLETAVGMGLSRIGSLVPTAGNAETGQGVCKEMASMTEDGLEEEADGGINLSHIFNIY